MSWKNKLKYLARSRSPAFVRAMDHGAALEDKTLAYRGKPVHYRAGTSDPHLIYGILLKTGSKAEYAFPAKLAPEVILDIGANIGISAILLAERFPNAVIHAIEPVPGNVAMLKRNAETRPAIRPHQLALADRDGSMELMASDSERNFGGFSFFERGSDAGRKFSVATATPASFLAANGIDRVDLIKIDTEGAEHAILTAFDPAVLSKVTWITGELHGEKDFEVLAYLSQWFDIELKKSFKKRLFIFRACNREALHLL
jgi:FkbM family methyltransferase